MTFNQVVEQSKEFLRGLTVRQRLLLAGGAVLVAATLLVFVLLIGKPDYKTLYSGLTPNDASTITKQLSEKKIPFEQSPDGASILVPADKLDEARLQVASQPMPRSGRMGFELFDKPNWAGSDFSEKVNYQRALEAELERTLETLGEVEGVRVHLVLPEDSLYTQYERVAKASVILKLHAGARLPEASNMAIRQLVAGAVDRLSPENVVVIDADTDLPLGRTNNCDSNQISQLDAELAKRVTETLEPVVGAQGVRASVHVEYDLSSGEETQESYDPNTAVALSMTRSEENDNATSMGGVPGTSSNLPNAQISKASKSDGEGHSSKTESGTYAVNKLIRHTINPAGRIKRIAAALLIDDAVVMQPQKAGPPAATRRKRTPDEMKQIEDLARATLGIDATRGDLLAVENLSFQGNLPEAPPPPGRLEKLRRILHDWSQVLRYVALACLFGSVYLLLLRPMKRQLLVAFRELPVRLGKKRSELQTEEQQLPPGPPTIQELLGPNAEADPSFKKLGALKNALIEKVKKEPAGASRLVANWLRQGGVE